MGVGLKFEANHYGTHCRPFRSRLRFATAQSGLAVSGGKSYRNEK